MVVTSLIRPPYSVCVSFNILNLKLFGRFLKKFELEIMLPGAIATL